MRSCSDLSHVSEAHKVPAGDTPPYLRAKRVQMVDKDPNRAIVLFWAAINEGDRVDSALKDMAMVMKQQNRAEEAIEVIKSLRNRCSHQAQESLDNILFDLFKRCGRIDDQIALLKDKLMLIKRGLAFNGKRTKTARSQGRKFQLIVEQEETRLLGNLGWALMQKKKYKEAEAAYRQALRSGPDNNKRCNLGNCLMQQGCVAEAKNILMQVRGSSASHLKAFERAQEMLRDLEKCNPPNWRFESILGQSSAAIWQPHPCIDEKFAIEPDLNRNLNVDAAPFYSSKVVLKKKCLNFGSENLQLSNLKRRRSIENRYPELPNADEFDTTLVEAILLPNLLHEEEEEETVAFTSESRVISSTQSSPAMPEGKKLDFC